jgi:hypothetical protein
MKLGNDMFVRNVAQSSSLPAVAREPFAAAVNQWNLRWLVANKNESAWEEISV